MRKFPDSLIKPVKAMLSGVAGDASLEIELCSFALNGEEVDTSIRLEGIAIPSVSLASLKGLAFQFPVNPEPGYIDGSIYIEHAHHPVDIHHLSFAGSIVSVRGMLVFEHEGLDDYANTPFNLTVPVQSDGA